MRNLLLLLLLLLLLHGQEVREKLTGRRDCRKAAYWQKTRRMTVHMASPEMHLITFTSASGMLASVTDLVCCSMSHNQARSVYAGDDTSDVQDSCTECSNPCLQSECSLSGWSQVQRHAGHNAGTAACWMLSLYFSL